MPTDDERREVARRLRKAIGLTEFAEALGFNWTDDSDWGWKDVSNLVADLIEPAPSCELWDAEEQECYSIRTVRLVDRDELLEIASEMRCVADEDAPFALRAFSRRIRKVLGVES